MADLDFWLELDPVTDPIKVTVSQNTPVHRLKDIILARLESLKGKIPEASSYQFICLRNGWIISDNEDPVSLFLRENDRFMVKSVPIASPNQAGDTLVTKGEFNNAPINDLEANSDVVTLSTTFDITGIPPAFLDFVSDYPVLAIYVKNTRIGSARLKPIPKWPLTRNLLFNSKPIYAKDTFFFITDQDGGFKWMSAEECNLFFPGMSGPYPLHENKRLTRYSTDKEVGDNKNMVIPLRPFSITGITSEGFDPEKSYPVLAIDIDQYIPETQDNAEMKNPEEESSESIALVLVGNDNGEFVWVAENECHLFPLKT